MEGSSSREERRESDGGGLLDVYIRNNKKQALLVHTPQNATLAHLASLIHSRFRVPPAHQLLFYNGQELAPSPHRNSLHLAHQAIIHLVDRRNIAQDLIINIRRLAVPRTEQFRVPASQIIEDFIVRHIRQEESERLFLVYTGRELDPRRSFAEEFVEDCSEIFCLDEEKDELRGDRRRKYETKHEAKRETKKKTSKSLRSHNDTIKEASVEDSADITPTPVEKPSREEKEEEPKTPNFKKKNISQEVNLAVTEPGGTLIVPPSQENSTSLVGDQFQENKSSLAPNPFFNEGSSISSICSEENHNPESSKRLDEPSVMFHSAYIGLNNDNLTSRPGSYIVNQSDSREDEPEAAYKTSFSFDNRAPEALTNPQLTINREIMEESKEDYSESREEKSSPRPENSKDLSVYELESIEHHQLSASAELEVEMFENKESPPKAPQNEILIEDFEREEGRKMEDLGRDIEPIAYSHHELQREGEGQPTCSLALAVRTVSEEELGLAVSDEGVTPRFDEGQARQLDVYVIEHSELAQPTESEMVEEKEERETNRHSSNLHSNSSSRARNYDINNEYNFGQFERFNRNRFSGYRDASDSELHEAHTSKSERSQEERPSDHLYPEETLGVQDVLPERKKSIDDDHSLNIVELPIDARIKDNSSLLIDYESKSDFSPIHPDLTRQKLPHLELQKQSSGIDELSKLLQVEKPGPQQSPISSDNSPQPSANSNSLDREALELVHHEHDHPAEEVIETSLNLRMSRRVSRDDAMNSPVVMKEMKGVIDSSESLEKIEVKNSLPYFNSYSRSISSEVRFTNHKEIYSIGDFVFNCDAAPFNPLAFFIEALSKQDSLDVYRSYP